MNKNLPIYLSLLLLLTCAKEDSQDPGTTPSNITPKYILTATAGEGGSVAPATGSFNAGTQVSITATPSAGYTFSGWSNGSSSDNPSNSYTKLKYKHYSKLCSNPCIHNYCIIRGWRKCIE